MTPFEVHRDREVALSVLAPAGEEQKAERAASEKDEEFEPTEREDQTYVDEQKEKQSEVVSQVRRRINHKADKMVRRSQEAADRQKDHFRLFAFKLSTCSLTLSPSCSSRSV